MLHVRITRDDGNLLWEAYLADMADIPRNLAWAPTDDPPKLYFRSGVGIIGSWKMEITPVLEED